MAVGKHKTVAMKNGKLILLNRNDSEDLNFVREAYGFEAEERGWFREKDRLFAFSDVLETFQAEQLLSQPEPANILDVPLPAVPDGELSEELLSMPDGAVVKWVRHPSLLPENPETLVRSPAFSGGGGERPGL